MTYEKMSMNVKEEKSTVLVSNLKRKDANGFESKAKHYKLQASV